MPTLLHVDSSLRLDGSRSRALSGQFARRWQDAQPDGVVIYRDLAFDPLPHLDLQAFSANFVAADDRTAGQREGWDHRDAWLVHVLSQIGIDDIRFIHAELTLSRESPKMSGLEALEDKSIADARAEIDALFASGVAA
jgi:FMN-dependent NADH-azoreductase